MPKYYQIKKKKPTSPRTPAAKLVQTFRPAPVARAPLPPRPTYVAPTPVVRAPVRTRPTPTPAPAQTTSFVRRAVTPPPPAPLPSPEQQFISAGYDTHEAFRLASIGADQAVKTPAPVPSMAPTSMNLAPGFQQPPVTSFAPTSMNVARLAPSYSQEQVVIRRQPSQFTGPEYYRGGSEQAYLGPVAQAEAFFLGTQGERWQLGASYRGIAPEDRNPPAFLSSSTVRILTQGVAEESRVSPDLIERLYEFDPVTNMWVLKQGAAPPPLTGGYYDGGYYDGGYGGGNGGGYGGGYSGLPRSGGGRATMGLVNWRI